MQGKRELYVGLMSGTSMDGVDAALVDLSNVKPVYLAKHYLEFDSHLKNILLALHQPADNELHQAQIAGIQLSKLYAATVKQLLFNSAVAPHEIIAIGCHGQTIRHCPELGYSVQVGNAALLTELTGITVIHDFRSRDIAAGGQGAPLVPAFHDKVFRHPDIHRVIVNIGGISNLTQLAPDSPTSGFDCGPGNILMDAWCHLYLGTSYDDNGVWASSGKISHLLLKKMLNEPYFSLPPPKSSGRDLFNLAWLRNMLHGNERPEDVQATLMELTCQSIALATQRYCAGAEEIYLCGGGTHNKALCARLAALLPECIIQTTNSLGIDADYLEAVAFAWLAQQAFQGKPANLPAVTGARHPCILGAIHYA